MGRSAFERKVVHLTVPLADAWLYKRYMNLFTASRSVVLKKLLCVVTVLFVATSLHAQQHAPLSPGNYLLVYREEGTPMMKRVKLSVSQAKDGTLSITRPETSVNPVPVFQEGENFQFSLLYKEVSANKELKQNFGSRTFTRTANQDDVAGTYVGVCSYNVYQTVDKGTFLLYQLP